jgi:hypothetical protein
MTWLFVFLASIVNEQHQDKNHKMNLKRGFLRVTTVASLVTGIVLVYWTDKPSLESFRWRTPTAAEKTKADEWWVTYEQAREPERIKRTEGPFKGMEFDYTDPRLIPKLTNEETALRSIHFGRSVLKDYQPVQPIALFLRYYVWPFSLGMLVVWFSYAVIRFMTQGFTKQD